MPYAAIDFQKKGRVALVTLKRDLIDSNLALDLRQVCLEITQDAAVVVAILSGGADGHFCRGTDWEELARLRKESDLSAEEIIGRYSAANAIGAIEKPVLAAITGDALGQGLELALACDIRLAALNSRFGFPPETMRLFPFDGASQRLPRLVGRSQALEMLATGKVIDAPAALKIGLINSIATRAETEAAALASKMAEKAPLSLRFAKEAVTKGMDLTLAEGLRLESDLYFLMHTTADRTEGITAFREKRKPEFKGS